MKARLLCLLFITFFTHHNLRAQELLPFVENFTKSEYTGDNQVWNVAQGSDNAMYFANHHHFLRYNGVKWEKYSLPNRTIIRSIFTEGDRIYCGSYKEFGYWKRIKGRMKYFSMSANKGLFLGNADNEEIWKIFRHGDKLYFQSFNEIYISEGEKIEKLKFPSQISYCYPIDDKLYVASVHNGVFELRGRKFVKADYWPELVNHIIHGMQKHKGLIYVFTVSDGIFTGDEGGLKPWINTLNSTLINDRILTAKFTGDNTLTVGTALNGLYIIDMKTGTYRNINRKNGLKNNAVLSIAADKENDLWVGLDNGISHIEVNSPINIFSDNSGILGSVYSLSTLEDGYLFVTNLGIFTYRDKEIAPVPYSQGQVWDIYKHDNMFVIGHNDGTFTYDGHQLRRVNPVNGGWKFLKSDYDGVYFQANYSGIAVYKDINDLSKWKILDSITKPVRNIAQNRRGELWAADNYRSLYRIKYDSDFNVTQVENISRINKINSDFGVKIFNFRNEILFLINNTWYNFNRISNRLEKHKLFNTVFNDISDIIPIDDDSFMVIKGGLLYLISQKGDDFIWKLVPEKYYQGKLIMENTRVYNNSGQLLINLDDGFFTFEAGRNKIKEQLIVVEGYYQGRLINDATDIEYNQPVELNVVAGYFGFNRPDLFYKLNEGKEFTAVKGGSLILNNLSSGSQHAEIYFNNGLKFVKIAEYKFKVGRPWHFSVPMVLLYLVAISGVFFLYYRWNTVRYRQKIRLNDEELKHRRMILELEMEAENKLRQQEYEKHMLEVEVQTKASEVAGKSLSIAKHSEMIESIQVALESEVSGDQLKTQLRKIIKTNSISKNEWQSFEKNLVKSHDEFVNRLLARFPVLTPKDIKLCIYLRMNLSSKEIAPLMNISFRGVELHRYRLRKKLEISSDESLSKFMINI